MIETLNQHLGNMQTQHAAHYHNTPTIHGLVFNFKFLKIILKSKCEKYIDVKVFTSKT